MYSASLIMMVGIPLALGSYWAFLVLIPAPIGLAVRILDEEKALTEELDGYREYMQNVHYRLVPHVW
jgi:protein-S-isoprenylcysteine O-methyltransferase Ste14